ncbi:MAG: ECF transporter S component, partial [Eubacterium sp.]|nr:ECF transporter S component [Eubacterium sp.]
LSGFILGPTAGFIVGFISDLLCFFIKPAGPYFIGFTLAMGLTGMIPGLLWTLMKKYDIKHLEWFNLAFIIVAAAILIFTGVFTLRDGVFYYGDNALNPLLMVLLLLLMLAYVLYPIFAVKRAAHPTNYRSDYVLFIVSISQLVTSIILNTWFLTILYGQAVTVLLPARIITNVFLIPLYTIALTGLLKVLPKFIKN